jgi:hypothetical protein
MAAGKVVDERTGDEMSQERTRFPIQPKDVRRSATSNRDVAVSGKPGRGERGKDQDKPTGPPRAKKDKAAEESPADEG